MNLSSSYEVTAVCCLSLYHFVWISWNTNITGLWFGFIRMIICFATRQSTQTIKELFDQEAEWWSAASDDQTSTVAQPKHSWDGLFCFVAIIAKQILICTLLMQLRSSWSSLVRGINDLQTVSNVFAPSSWSELLGELKQQYLAKMGHC